MSSLIEISSVVLSIALSAAIAVTFIGKTGYSKWLGLLLIVPVANLIFLLYLLAFPWPVARELAMRRLESGEGSREDGWLAYSEAVRAQKAGRFTEAHRLYDSVIRCFPESSPGVDARIGKNGIPRQAEPGATDNPDDAQRI